MTIGVAVIGCGGMGSWHARNIAAQPGLEVVAVADAMPGAADDLAGRLGARVGDGAELIAASDVDAVVVASTDETHAGFAVASIEAGKPCLCEKPLGATVEQAQTVLDAEVRAGRQLVRVGFMRPLDPAHRQVAAALDDLGAITRVRCVHRNVDPQHRGVGVIFAQSIIHDIHTIRWLTGQEFERVAVYAADRTDGYRDVLVVGELSGGSIGTVDFEDQAFAYEVHVEVTAERGMAATLPHPRVVTRTGATESIRVGTDWFGRFEEAYRTEIEQWAGDLRCATFSGPTVWDAYVAQVVARAGEVAMRSASSADVSIPQRPALYGGPA